MSDIKDWKTKHIVLLVMICIAVNYLGKLFANALSLPFWLDSIGTIFVAYVLGPVCGVMVGFTCNLAYGINDPNSILYGLTSAAIAISVGALAKKIRLRNFFSTMSLSVYVTFISVVISAPLNILLYGGYTGNIWGDGVIDFLRRSLCR